MSINTTATTEVTFDTTTVTDVPTTDLVSTNAHCVDAVDTTSIVEGYKKEYSIVGDGIYASVSADEAPEWLLSLIDNTVANSVANGLTDYDLLVQDVRNAIDALDIAKNTYVESIDITAIVDGIVASHITTLNATYGDTFATKVELSTAVATATEAYASDIVDLRAEFTDDINSRVTEITDAYAAADQVNANNIDVLTSVLTDQITGLSGTANAVSGLQTYVGLDYDGIPNNTGLLASIDQIGDTTTSLQNQLDGKIEYYFYDSYAGVPGALTEEGALSIISSAWNTQELQEANNGSVVYFKDTVHAYWYKSSSNTWVAITDTSIYKALQDAASAQAAADGKVSQFYAWGGTSAPADFTFDGNTIPGNNYKYWFKTDSKLYYKPVATWVLVPTTSTGSTYIALGDLLTVFSPDTLDYTNYSFNGTSWQQNGPNGIISKSKFFVDLENEVTGPTGYVATSLSNLQTTSETYANSVGAGVENKFSYDSTIGLNGTYYKSGFGLTSLGVTQPPGANGTLANPYSSKFWVNANNFTISDTYGAANPVFSVDTLTRDVVFNGKVIFTSGGATQVGTIDEAITASVTQVAVGDKNINITDNLIPTTSLITDLNNAGYQFVGDPVKASAAGVDTFAEPQITLDSNDEVYSPYVDEIVYAYYYRFGIYGISNFNSIKIVTINATNTVTYGSLVYEMEPGQTLSPTQWYVIDGIINPTGGNNDFAGAIRLPDGTKVGNIRNYVIPSGAVSLLLGWQYSCIISRMKLAKITADTLVGSYATTDFVDSSITWDNLTGKDTLAATLGYGNYAAMTTAATNGTTVINGGYLNTSLIEAEAITASMIDTTGLSIKDENGTTIFASGTPLTAGYITPSSTWLNSNISINSNGTLTGAGTGQVTIAGLDNTVIRSGTPITSANISTYISSAAIGEAYIGNLAVTNAKIANGAITNAKIGNAQVDTLQIAGNAVTVPVSSFTSAETSLPTGTWKTVQSIVVDSGSFSIPSYITFGFHILTGYRIIQTRLLEGTNVMVTWPEIWVGSGLAGSSYSFAFLTPNYSGVKTYNLQVYTPSAANTVSHRYMNAIGVKR